MQALRGYSPLATISPATHIHFRCVAVGIGVQGFARLGDEVEELLPVPEDQVGEGGGEVFGEELLVAGDVAVLVGVDVVVVQLAKNLIVSAHVVRGSGHSGWLSVLAFRCLGLVQTGNTTGNWFWPRLRLPAGHVGPARRPSHAGSIGRDGCREVQAQARVGGLLLLGNRMLVVLLAAAAHDHEVSAVHDDPLAGPAAVRADKELPGRAEAEDRDDCLIQPVRRRSACQPVPSLLSRYQFIHSRVYGRP